MIVGAAMLVRSLVLGGGGSDSEIFFMRVCETLGECQEDQMRDWTTCGEEVWRIQVY